MLDGLKECKRSTFYRRRAGTRFDDRVELVADRMTKEPLDKTITRILFHEALERASSRCRIRRSFVSTPACPQRGRSHVRHRHP